MSHKLWPINYGLKPTKALQKRSSDEEPSHKIQCSIIHFDIKEDIWGWTNGIMVDEDDCLVRYQHKSTNVEDCDCTEPETYDFYDEGRFLF